MNDLIITVSVEDKFFEVFKKYKDSINALYEALAAVKSVDQDLGDELHDLICDYKVTFYKSYKEEVEDMVREAIL